MKTLHEYRKQAQAARDQRALTEQTLQKRRNLLYQWQGQLERALRLGEAGKEEASKLQFEIQVLQQRIASDLQATGLQAFSAQDVPLQAQPWELVEGLSDSLPFLLLPVRVETRFMTVDDKKELWVRFFPDDIAVHTHEIELTSDEVEAGKTYWREIWAAQQESNADKQQVLEKGAWRALAEAYGGTRAAWIARRTKPETLDVPNVATLRFPAFPDESLKPQSWSQSPRSKVMPDRFVVMGFFQGKEVFRQAGNPIPDPLIVGPDPQKAEAEFRQENGQLIVGEDIAWIYDFPEAVKNGMGLQIELEAPFDTRGLDRLLVLGLRLSADENDTQSLVEELFENHSYAPDGLSLIPQGTPTNNTDRKGSGFSTADPGAETSFTVETGEPLFEPVDTSLDKRDGQWLVEALGIGHELFQRIRFADGGDVREALLMNRALWSGTLGYYLEEMLELNPTRSNPIQSFFAEYVSGRGLLPAVRVGSQPYGVLVTSDFSRWVWSPDVEGGQFASLEEMTNVMRSLNNIWRGLLPGVARIGAPGDPFQNLLNTLGLQPTSVEFYRRHGVGKEYLWNYEAFTPGAFQGTIMMDLLADGARSLAQEVGISRSTLPSIYDISFFQRQDQIRDPLVDDIPADEPERLSETKRLRAVYLVPDPSIPGESFETNYIGWLAFSDYQTLKTQRFVNAAGESLPMPRPLLYRMLRASLLEAVHDAVMRLYTRSRIVPPQIRREVELSNVPEQRTVTRWEFMDADISQVLPNESQDRQSVAAYLLSEEGLKRPEAALLRQTLESIRALIDLPTARLERAFVEHIDLCSYRLDAWQTGCFNRRLLQQRFPPEREAGFANRVQGTYLGAFGWVENLRPSPGMTPADITSIPTSLHDPQTDGTLFEQPDSAGFIHAPSLNHAVTAAVLRNAYLTHFDPAHPEKMAVDLSSERVRTALAFLEGVRNGQELGALLGYQFERGLHDRYNDPSLNQYIPFFRQRFPLVADKITQDASGEQIESKEARNVFDGYALLEVAFLQEPPQPYPYGVSGLPSPNTNNPQQQAHVAAIQAEVARMADSLDAIADLALAEGVYQVAQGNFERAGAMLNAMTQGNSPVDPEIVRTPRSGTTITQRVALHLQTGAVTSPWPGALGKRATVEPGLNKWLGDLLPRPAKIRYVVRLNGGDPVEQNLSPLGLQPIDLVYMIGDDLAGATTELESRIAFENRRLRQNDSLEVQIEFMAPLADPQSVTLFELLPLLRALRQIVTSSRPLDASDYRLASEATTDPAADPNPQGIVLAELKARAGAALTAFATAVNALQVAIPAPGADGQPNTNLANPARLRTALRTLADFGVPDAFPLSAFGNTPEIKTALTQQAVGIHPIVSRNLENAQGLKTAGDDASLPAQERVARYRAAAQAIFGPSFNLIPQFNFKNRAEVQAAASFRDASPAASLTRHHKDNPLLLEEWLQGIAHVQPRVGTLETAQLLGENFGTPRTLQKPLQLPFRQTDHWVAVEYPDTFVPEGEYLSILQVFPGTGFLPSSPQSGLMIDEWNEVIPGKSEVSGIAVHINQPNTEPPQTVLLAVTPQITGAWTWDKLVGILNDTFDRAQLRAVEPELIGDTALGQLLPAILTPVASHRFATITADLVYQTAVAVSTDN